MNESSDLASFGCRLCSVVRVSPLSASQRYPSTLLQDGLSAWTVILKDLVKRTTICSDEAELMLSSTRFLVIYQERASLTDASSPAADGNAENVLFRYLRDHLLVQTQQVRDLHEALKDELVVLQLLIQGTQVSYEGLSEGKRGPKGDWIDSPPIVCPRPGRASAREPEDTEIEGFLAGLEVIAAAPAEDITTGVMAFLETSGPELEHLSGVMTLFLGHPEAAEGQLTQAKLLAQLIVRYRDQVVFPPDWLRRRIPAAELTAERIGREYWCWLRTKAEDIPPRAADQGQGGGLEDTSQAEEALRRMTRWPETINNWPFGSRWVLGEHDVVTLS